MSALLEVDDLHVTYLSSRGPIPAVRGVSLRLSPGETLGLAGESGSGKSTMTMALLRLVPVGTTITGSITLAGEDVLAMKPGRLRAVRWAEAAVVFARASRDNVVTEPGSAVSTDIIIFLSWTSFDQWEAQQLALAGLRPSQRKGQRHLSVEWPALPRDQPHHPC